MAIDLSKLSAKELFELALRKEQEEKQQEERQQQLIELQKKRALLMSAHQVALAEIERKISELTSQRSKLIAEHEKSMGTVGKEISELTQKIQETERLEKAVKVAAPQEKAAVVPPKIPEPAPAPAAQTISPAPAPAPTPAPAPVPAARPAPVVKPAEMAPAAEEKQPQEEMGEIPGATTIDSKDELFEKIRDLMRTRSFISHGLLKEQLKVKGYSVPNLSKLVDQLIRDGKLASAGGGNYALGKKA